MENNNKQSKKITIQANLFPTQIDMNLKRIFRARKILQIKDEPKPFDGYVSKQKKMRIVDLLKTFDNNKRNKLINLFEVPYPLLPNISTRKNINKTKNLVKKLLTIEYNNLTQAQQNTINYKTYKLPIKHYKKRDYSQIILKPTKESLLKEKNKQIIENLKNSMVLITKNSNKNTDIKYNSLNSSTENNTVKNSFYNTAPLSLRTQYQQNNLREHISNAYNHNILRSENLNSIYNGYKIDFKEIERKKQINEYKSDLIGLKVHNHIRLIPNTFYMSN
jgi:hypothetical protein